MKRKRKIIAIGAMLLLLLAMCVPVFSGALAADEEQLLVVPIAQETALFGADGAQIGTLAPETASGTVLRLTSGEAFLGVRVIYDHAAANKAEKSDLFAGKALVTLTRAGAVATPEATPETPEETPETTAEASGAIMPEQGWIDASLIVTAQSARHAVDLSKLAAKDAKITSLQSAAQASGADDSASDAQLSGNEMAGIFSVESMAAWVPVAAIALGVLGVALLASLAISTATAARVTEGQTGLLSMINDQLTAGLKAVSPLKVEQAAWPREGRVQIVSEALDRVAALAHQGGAYRVEMSSPVQREPEPPPVPEGEEPDLLKLANRLAGVASAAEWHALVNDAGWRAALLQSNPTEKGTYIADDSGYSIIACLMRSVETELAYVVPSYQDPNASEPRWSEFYAVSEDMAVRNYRVDALAVMYIERGTFFLQKSKGKLTRRPQFF